eukprot:354395-Chlamydomonas_euryale.AAC.1
MASRMAGHRFAITVSTLTFMLGDVAGVDSHVMYVINGGTTGVGTGVGVGDGTGDGTGEGTGEGTGDGTTMGMGGDGDGDGLGGGVGNGLLQHRDRTMVVTWPGTGSQLNEADRLLGPTTPKMGLHGKASSERALKMKKLMPGVDVNAL